MKRLLTHEEKNAIKVALDFLVESMRNGHHSPKILVANYSGSYPDNPDKAKVFMNARQVENIFKVFDHDEDMDYDDMVDNYLLTQPDDTDDHLMMIDALSKGIHKIIVELNSR